MVIGTVSQIEVNQGLIGDAFGVSQRLEVVDGAAVDVDGNLLFQPVRQRSLQRKIPVCPTIRLNELLPVAM